MVRLQGPVSVVWVYCLLPPPPGQSGRMIIVFYWSGGRGFVIWGSTRDERYFPKCTGSGCFFLSVLEVGGIVLSRCGVWWPREAIGNLVCATFSLSQIDIVLL